LLGLMFGSSFVNAAPYVMSPGSTLTTGGASSRHSIQSVAHNPAAATLVLDQKERVRFAYLSGAGVGLEYGDMENFEDDLNDLIDTIDAEDTSLDDADDLIDKFNTVLPTLGEAGYLKIESRTPIPMFPIVARIAPLDAELSLNLSLDVQMKISLLDAPLVFNQAQGRFDTNSAVYVKSGILTQMAVGLSKSIWNHDVGRLRGQFITGARVNIYSLKLSKQVIALNSLGGEKIADVLSDEYKNNQISTTALGIDVGFLWVADKYHLGFTLTNINAPEFDYGIVGVGCEEETNITNEINCAVAREHVQALRNISSEETHVMNALGTVDASYKILWNWSVAISYELAKYNDIVGDENQWMVASTSYTPENPIVPAPRFGYRSNLAGSEISSLVMGATFFKIFNIDLEVALDTTTVGGSSAPRSFGWSIGFQEQF